MGTIKRLGAPSRNIKASIGDIYIDLKTGNKYQCVFSYVLAGTYECDWKLVDSNTKDTNDHEVEETPITKEEVIVEETPSVEEVVKEETSEPEPPVQQKRTDYASYSKKQK